MLLLTGLLAKAIREQSDVSKIDWEVLAAKTDIVGYPVLPLVEQMTTWVTDGMGKSSFLDMAGLEAHARVDKYIHWGATTQDIMDNASILQMKKGLSIVERYLKSNISALEKLAVTYRDTPMAGRTHLQHALPITFGYKCAVWLAGFQRHLERLEQIKERCLLVQFGGAAGTLASLGNDDTGIRVRKQLANVLGLKDPAITWHVTRDTVAEIVNFLALIGGSLGKIALDLIIMSSNEFNEVKRTKSHWQSISANYSRSQSHLFRIEAPPPQCLRSAIQSRVSLSSLLQKSYEHKQVWC